MSFATVMHWEREHCRTYLSGKKLKAYNCAAASPLVQTHGKLLTFGMLLDIISFLSVLKKKSSNYCASK